MIDIAPWPSIALWPSAPVADMNSASGTIHAVCCKTAGDELHSIEIPPELRSKLESQLAS